jgi:hypothetical protein
MSTRAPMMTREDALVLADQVQHRGTAIGDMTYHLLAEVQVQIEYATAAANETYALRRELDRREAHDREGARIRAVEMRRTGYPTGRAEYPPIGGVA